MKIISHRGLWLNADEKNTIIAFDRSFSLGYGTETDIRDFSKNILISHDMPIGSEVTLFELLKKISDFYGGAATLALNIKSDGLAKEVAKHLKEFPLIDCFVFDMSVPDMQSYFAAGIQVFTRMSEVEREPVWLDRSSGVWLDSFYSEWYDLSEIQKLTEIGKRVCIVSPELHQRPHKNLWEKLIPISKNENLILCTDFPKEAAEFFNFFGYAQ